MQRTKQIISIEPGSSAIWLPDKLILKNLEM